MVAGTKERIWRVALPILVLVSISCNLPLSQTATQATPSPTVTLTPGSGTSIPIASTPDTATPVSSPGLEQPTSTSFSLPPTPGRTPTEPYSTIPPHITSTPSTAQPGEGPQIEYFTASPTEIDPGGSITLSWKASGDSITLYPISPSGQLGSPGTTVQPEGSTTVTTDSSLRNSVSYMLFATTGSKTVSATVQVAIHCPDTWFFDNPPAICPSGPVTISEGASEHFEHGWMLWVAGNDMIYVLYDDQASPRWASYTNHWESGMPESDPAILPPAGFYQPLRGFGLLWRTEEAGQSYSPRARLGWATEPESSFTTAFQCDSAPKYGSCYLKSPSGETIWLKPERSGWQIWTGPSS
jgi:hypothetical protein